MKTRSLAIGLGWVVGLGLLQSATAAPPGPVADKPAPLPVQQQPDSERWILREGWTTSPNGSRPVNSAMVDPLLNEDLLESYEIAAQHAANGNWMEALKSYQAILESEQDGLIALDDGAHFMNIKASAVHHIFALGPSALKLYRARYDAIAEAQIKKALAARDAQSMQRIAERFAATSHGPRALKQWGDLSLEKGDLDGALDAWERLAAIAPQELDAPTRAKMTAAYTFVREPRSAQRHLKALQGTDPDRVDLRDAKSGLTRLEQLVRRGREAFPILGWPQLGGDNSRAQKAPAISPISGPLWSNNFTEAGYSGNPKQMRHHMNQPFPAVATVASEEQIYLSTGYAIFSYPIWGSGAPLWFYPADKRNRPAQFEPSRFARNNLPITLDGDRLYATLVERNTKLRRLVCLDASTGRKIWQAGAVVPARPHKNTVLPYLDIHGAPAVRGETVYVLGSMGAPGRQDIHRRRHGVPPPAQGTGTPYFLVSLRRTDGSLNWARVVSREVPRLNRQSSSLFGIMDASPVAIGRSTVYCVTNGGTVAAVNADTGSIRWVTQYPRREITLTIVNRIQLQRNRNLTLRERWGRNDYLTGWRDIPPMLLGGRLYVSPRDADDLYCMDPVTGRILWQFQRALGSASTFDASALRQRARNGQARWAAQVVGADPDRQILFLAGKWTLYALDCAREGAFAAPPLEIPGGGMIAQGVVAGDHLYLPTTEAIYKVSIDELLSLEANEEYNWPDRTPWDPLAARAQIAVPDLRGNLTVTGEVMAVTSSTTVSVLYSAQQRYEQLTVLIAKAPQSEQAGLLMKRGKVMFHEADYDVATADFRKAFEIRNAAALRADRFDWTHSNTLWTVETLDAYRGKVREATHTAAQSRQALAQTYLVRARQAAEQYLPGFASQRANPPASPAARAAAAEANGWFKKASAHAVLTGTFIQAQLGRVRCQQVLDDWSGVIDEYQMLLTRCPQASVEAGFPEGIQAPSSVQPAGAFARGRIRQILTAQGRSLYGKYEAKAKALLDGVPTAPADVPALKELIARYPNSLAAGKALMRMADGVAKAGSTLQAMRHWRTYLRSFPDGDRVGDAMKSLAGQYEKDGRLLDAKEQLLVLGRLATTRPIWVIVKGKPVDGKRYVETRLAETKFADVFGRRSQPLTGVGAPSWRKPMDEKRKVVQFVPNATPEIPVSTVVFTQTLVDDPYTTTLSFHDAKTGAFQRVQHWQCRPGLLQTLQAGEDLYIFDSKRLYKERIPTGGIVWRTEEWKDMAPKEERHYLYNGRFLSYVKERTNQTFYEVAWSPVRLLSTGDELCALFTTLGETTAVGIDPLTGEILWSRPLGAAVARFASAQLRPGYLLIPVLERAGNRRVTRILVLDSGTGERIYATRPEPLIPNKRMGNPAIKQWPEFSYATGEGRLYVQAGNRVVAYDLAQGSVVWKQKMESARTLRAEHYSAVPVDHHRIAQNSRWIAAIAQEKKLFIIDKATGSVEWSLDSRPGEVLLDCRLTADRVAVISTRNPQQGQGFLLGLSGRRDLHLRTISLATGKPMGVETRLVNVRHVYTIVQAADQLAILFDGESADAGKRTGAQVWVASATTGKTVARQTGPDAIIAHGTGISLYDGRLHVAGPWGVAALGQKKKSSE